MKEKTGEPLIRDAATVILSRHGREGPEVLMGQRGATAAFMPNKFVFPGGAVDPEDAQVPLFSPLSAACQGRLALEPKLEPLPPSALAATAARELWEETGLALARNAAWPAPAPRGWKGMAERSLLPHAAPLRFVFRAITPPGRSRRFDARFFLADASAVLGDTDDFSKAEDELAHLQWVPLIKARGLDLPFITEVVLAEIARQVEQDSPPDSVPFFDNSGPEPRFRRLT
jgi:8-oxo-dGTP pyrophosphatase MutT (NUDIX family)